MYVCMYVCIYIYIYLYIHLIFQFFVNLLWTDNKTKIAKTIFTIYLCRMFGIALNPFSTSYRHRFNVL